jgi:hypothetical protein
LPGTVLYHERQYTKHLRFSGFDIRLCHIGPTKSPLQHTYEQPAHSLPTHWLYAMVQRMCIVVAQLMEKLSGIYESFYAGAMGEALLLHGTTIDPIL